MKKLTSRQELILLTINNTDKSIDELIANNNLGEVTSRTIQRDIKSLEESNLLTRSGSGRSTKYKSDIKQLSALTISTETLEEILNTERNPVFYNFENLDTISNFTFGDEQQNKLSLVTNDFKSRRNTFVDE